MSGATAVIPKYQFSSAVGSPLVNGTLTTYLSGTTTLTPTYQDKALLTANTTTITLDSRGECVLWLNPALVYKFVLKDSAGVTQWTLNDISGAAPADVLTSLSAYMQVFLASSSAATARTNLGFTSALVDRAYAEYAANADLTTILPFDDTVPQNTEGTQIISVSLTPKSVTNRVRLRFQGTVFCNTTGINVTGAVFSSASANALAANFTTTSAAGFASDLVIEKEYVPGVTTALTFTVRVGPQSATAIRMNGNTTRLFGGSAAATLIVEEFA